MKKICPEFLSKNRAPITKTSIKKYGTVLDRIFNDDSLELNLVIEEDFSDSEAEDIVCDNDLENDQSESDDDNDILNDENFDERVRNHLTAVFADDNANEIMDVDSELLEYKEMDNVQLVKSYLDDVFKFGRTEIFIVTLLRIVKTKQPQMNKKKLLEIIIELDEEQLIFYDKSNDKVECVF